MSIEPSWTWWSADRGCAVRAGTVVAPTPDDRAVVALLPGRTEFVEKYEEVIGELVGRGWTTHVLDWRGQGMSSRLTADRYKGHIDSFETYLHDLQRFMETLVRPSGPRVVLLAHSMGGHLALRYLAERAPGNVVGLITTAPMIDVAVEGALYAAMSAASAALCLVGQSERWLAGARRPEEEAPFERNQWTSDRERYARMMTLQRDRPELAIGGFTAGWAHAAIRSIRTLRRPEVFARIAVPVTIVCAGRDTRVSNDAQREVMRWLRQGALVEVPEAMHELLFERDPLRAKFWEVFDAFMASVVSNTPP